MGAGGVVIGMDEAGYGPNLGPLVITATVWETPCPPTRFNFWKRLSEAVRCEPGDDDRLHVADSKAVYQPARGLGELERSVLALLGVLQSRPETFQRLRADLCGNGAARPSTGPTASLPASPPEEGPWYREDDVEVPIAACRDAVSRGIDSLSAVLQKAGVRLRTIACDLVTEGRFNHLWEAAGGNKAAALTELSLNLLSRVWGPEADAPTLMIADKHGGRNQYCGVLSHVFEGRLPHVVEESRDRSRYVMGNAELVFQARAEAHLPVAAASMVSKYVREAAMTAFNRFWRRHLPGIEPTAGYPSDARRFRRDIAAVQSRLAIPDHVLWRCR
jgi:hypothetical protein